MEEPKLNLLLRLREDNENVREVTLKCIQNLIKSSVVHENFSNNSSSNNSNSMVDENSAGVDLFDGEEGLRMLSLTRIRSGYVGFNWNNIVSRILGELKNII